MNQIDNQTLQEIVHRVVHQTMGRSSLPPDIEQSDNQNVQSTNPDPEVRVVAIGTDHGGIDLKETLKETLADAGYIVTDCGTHSKDSVDYPDIAKSVADLVAAGKAWRGVIIDGAGIGSCMAANKVPGVRAAMCYDHATAVNSREHNDANVLTLGAGLIGTNLAKQILLTWLSTKFGGDRHARRVDKIIAMDKSFLPDGKQK